LLPINNKTDPWRIPYAGNEADGLTVDYKAKYNRQLQSIKDNYKAFDQPYNGKDNDDYVNGQGFCCNDATPEAALARAMARTRVANGNFHDKDNYENMQFYYHPDHLGSSSYITNLDGEVSQHIEYVPFGEVFIEERNNTWNTPYLFNAKEFDEETGLYYYGARYYEPRLSLWMSTDPLEEDTPLLTTYCFVNNNPLIYIDPQGLDSYFTEDGVYLGDDKKKTHYVFSVNNGDFKFDKSGMNIIYKKTQLRNNQNKPITKNEFQELAGTLFAESSPENNNSWQEAAAIYSVLENRGNADNKSTLEVASGGGIYGYSKRNKIFDDKAPKTHVQNAYKGLIRGILDKRDYSNGGFYWHGSDFHMSKRRAYKDFYEVGFKFTNPTHDIWRMGSHTSSNSKWQYKYELTAAFGNTTFMKLSSKWQQANHNNHWDGTYKRK